MLNNAGASYLRAGDFPQSLQYLMEARSLVRTMRSLPSILPSCTTCGEQTEALAVLEEALRLHPNVAILHYLVGLVATPRDKASVQTPHCSRPASWERILKDCGERPPHPGPDSSAVARPMMEKVA